ncbi:hypothetical protein INR49_017341, partial [Caranx melampygus]
HTQSHADTHRPLSSTPTIETALCSSEFALPVPHLSRAIPGLKLWFIAALRMPFHYIPILEIFLGILGFGLSIMFCTTFCRACSRLREEEIEREAWRRSEQEGRPPPIYFIPFPRNISQTDGEDVRMPRHSQEINMPPRYSATAYCGAPPSYDELGCKPEDLPPAYSEHNVPVYPITPPPHTDTTQSQTWSEP